MFSGFVVVSVNIVFVASAVLSVSAFVANGQELTTETIAVSGNCGMCKSSIEKAAMAAGVTEATWDKDKKTILIKYDPATTSAAKVQQGIAAVGYDTRDVKATDKSYKKLPACCHYDRKPANDSKTELKAEEKSCCSKGSDEGKSASTTKSCCSKAASEHTRGSAESCCKKTN